MEQNMEASDGSPSSSSTSLSPPESPRSWSSRTPETTSEDSCSATSWSSDFEETSHSSSPPPLATTSDSESLDQQTGTAMRDSSNHPSVPTRGADTLRLQPPSEREKLMQHQMEYSWPEELPSTEMSPSASHEPPLFEYDVFLSCRSTLCRNFADGLYDALVERGIRTFKGGEELVEEQEIGELMVMIEKSEMFITIICANFCEAKINLLELAKIVSCKRLILPLFYRVVCRDVRNQTGPFLRAFQKWSEESREGGNINEQMLKEWKEGLTKAGSLSGFDICDGNQLDCVHRHQEEMIQIICKRVLTELNSCPLDVVKYPIGISSKLKYIFHLLDIGNNDVKTVGICGKEGIGKTTLALAAYNKANHLFDCSSFIHRVGNMVETQGITAVHNKLFSDISKTDTCCAESLGKKWIRGKKVFIVLDGVTDADQLEGLAKVSHSFHPGTRIIVTTQHVDVLRSAGTYNIGSYHLRELDLDQSLQLFMWHAFRKDSLEGEYAKLSVEFVRATYGLPLAIEIVGSFLFGKRQVEEWERILSNIKGLPPRYLIQCLKLIFDSLSDDGKSILLDVACIMEGVNWEAAIHVWNKCSITTLVHKSLLKVDNQDILQMHDLLRETGRRIMEEESEEPSKRRRLWAPEEILDILNHQTGTNIVEGIRLVGHDSHRSEDVDHHLQVHCESFASMQNLRLLSLSNNSLIGEYKSLPKKLKVFEWQRCPLESLPTDLALNGVSHLDLSHSSLVQLWRDKQKKVFDKLESLDLKYCNHLTKADLSPFPGLVRVILDGCEGVVELSEPIAHLKKLVLLSLNNCYKLEKLPDSICELTSLEKLLLDDCIALDTLPNSIHMLSSLETLSLRNCTSMRELPNSLFESTSLRAIDLSGCYNLERLPNGLSQMTSLNSANLTGCSRLTDLPDCISSSTSLKTLHRNSCPAWKEKKLRNENVEVVGLRSLGMFHLDPSMVSDKLLHLDLSYSLFLTELPAWLQYICPLEVLIVRGTLIRELPDFIGSFGRLRVLDAGECPNLSSLPHTIGNLGSLYELYLQGTSLLELPSSMGYLRNLSKLDIRSCEKLRGLLRSVGKSDNVIEILIDENNTDTLRNSIGMFKRIEFVQHRKLVQREGEEIDEELQLSDSGQCESSQDSEFLIAIRDGASIIKAAVDSIRFTQEYFSKKEADLTKDLELVEKLVITVFVSRFKEEYFHSCRGDAGVLSSNNVDPRQVLRRMVEGYITPGFLTMFQSNLTDGDFPNNVLDQFVNKFDSSVRHGCENLQMEGAVLDWVFPLAIFCMIGLMSRIPQHIPLSELIEIARQSELYGLQSNIRLPEGNSEESIDLTDHLALVLKSLQAVVFVERHVQDRIECWRLG